MNFEQVFVTIFTHPLVKAIAGLILANLLLGIAASIQTRTFKLDQLTEFLVTMVVPQVGGGAICQLILWALGTDFLPPELAQLTGTVVWGAVITSLTWRALRHLKALWPGLPLPIEPAVNQDSPTTAITAAPVDPQTIDR